MFAVVSGKGGVGKSTVCALIACELQRRGYTVGILDADIGGASIAHLFGLKKEHLNGFFATSKNGIRILSFALLAKDQDRASIWRGPLITNALKQLYDRLDFGELDYLLIDSPPGTSDVPLTLYQYYPLDGIVVTTTPHDLVREVVARSIKMAQRLSVPILGIIENMSHLVCDNCKKKHFVFGNSKSAEVARDANVPLLAQLPLDPKLAELEDKGQVDTYESAEMKKAVDELIRSSSSQAAIE
ncbi:MAG: Mrp/NBP35 family ATP-binding protein [Candidatus Aenigmarchaeota archaeon]|nr:Mrp/NBP35 family ATP-binding protein [Candidatus Aenigmarchaeota archaeon]